MKKHRTHLASALVGFLDLRTHPRAHLDYFIAVDLEYNPEIEGTRTGRFQLCEIRALRWDGLLARLPQGSARRGAEETRNRYAHLDRPDQSLRGGWVFVVVRDRGTLQQLPFEFDRMFAERPDLQWRQVFRRQLEI